MRSRRAKSDRSTPHRWATITRLRAISVIGVLTLGVAAPTFTAQVQDAAAAPSAALVTSPSGRLSVSRSIGLEPAGATVQVNGTGFDTNKGIYVALCVIPSPGVAPSPCGGGIAMEGSTGASHWISSNPPSYGVGRSTRSTSALDRHIGDEWLDRDRHGVVRGRCIDDLEHRCQR